jgi:CheY-like chemotaxis protein
MSSDFRVIPVLLPGGSKEPSQFLPPFLQRITWVEITDCNNDHEGFGRLLCGIKGSMPGPVVAQKMAQWRVGLGGSLKEFDKDRQEVLDRLREILLDPHLTIILVEEGSIVLHLKGSRFALERLQTLISLGQLKELAGLEILHVLEEPSQQQGGAVAPHWLGKKMIRRILFVDDDQNLAQTVCQILQSHGYVAKSAHSGNAAMEMFKQELFDLAIVDFRLEDMDGISLASEIHKMAPAVPIIIVTGYERIEPTAEIVTCIHKENLFPALSDVIKQLSKAA